MNDLEKEVFLEYVGNDDAVLWDGFDDAIIGHDGNGKIVYDADKMKDILVERDEMTEEEALEYLSFNVFGSDVGEYTPIHVFLKSNII